MMCISQQSDLIKRIRWLIRLRWVAVCGVTLTVFFTNRLFALFLPVFPIYGVVVFLIAYNSFFLIYLNRLKLTAPTEFNSIANRLANIQISLDLLCLVILIHFSGGIENPFIFYFIFHMIIASILLSRRAAFLQATLATLLFGCLASFEYLGIITHYSLPGFIQGAYSNPLYLAGVFFVFASTLYIAVYMATDISLALKEANQHLTEKDRAKSEYVVRVTHDIKEHLSAVKSCIEPVTGGITGKLNKQQEDLLKRAVKRTSKLLFFVKSLLDISRIKLSGDIKFGPVELKNVINNSAAYVELRAKDSNIEFTVNIDPRIQTISGIETYLEETISNLLANAVKYTPAGGRVSLEAVDEGNSVLLKIRDSGIGIPAGEISKIFDEFYRADNAKKVESSGTGLGLSIAKQVVTKHCGKICVESEENKGSCFSISLPKEHPES